MHNVQIIPCIDYIHTSTLEFEFSLNYTKLVSLTINVYVEKSKTNSAKKVTSIGDQTRDLL